MPFKKRRPGHNCDTSGGGFFVEGLADNFQFVARESARLVIALQITDAGFATCSFFHHAHKLRGQSDPESVPKLLVVRTQEERNKLCTEQPHKLPHYFVNGR